MTNHIRDVQLKRGKILKINFNLKSKIYDLKKRDYAVIISVALVFVSLVIAVSILSGIVEKKEKQEVVVCLDAGHGGEDVGAVSADGKRFEKDDNLELTLKVKDELEKMGIKVILTRDSDETVSLEERCRIANEKGCGIYVSLHRNSASSDASGIEIWLSHDAGEKETKTANKILEKLCKTTDLPDRGIKYGYRDSSAKDYYINANTNMPSMLLEVGFITSDKDNKAYDENMDEMAKEIAKVIYASL